MTKIDSYTPTKYDDLMKDRLIRRAQFAKYQFLLAPIIIVIQAQLTAQFSTFYFFFFFGN